MLPKKVNKTNFMADFFASGFGSSAKSPPIKKYAGISSSSQNIKNTNISFAVNIPRMADINSKCIE